MPVMALSLNTRHGSALCLTVLSGPPNRVVRKHFGKLTEWHARAEKRARAVYASASKRRACRLVALSREAHRHPTGVSPQHPTCTAAININSLPRRGIGDRRSQKLLRAAHADIHHKRGHRLHPSADFVVRKRKQARRPPLPTLRWA